MTAPYLALNEPLNKESEPRSGFYNRKALVVLALLSGVGGVALWNQLAGGEPLSTIAMFSVFTQPAKAAQTMQRAGAWSSMQGSWRPMMQPASVSQPMWPTSSQPFLRQVSAEAEAKAAAKPKPKPKPTPPPFSEEAWLKELEAQLEKKDTLIKFGGGTGGLLRKAREEESYIMTWKNPKGETVFEMPTGGAAVMNAGDNMMFLARKEYGIALGNAFRKKFKIKDYRIFRRLPNGEIQFIHPADGVFPEKANPGRKGANQEAGSILQNSKP